MEMPFTPSAKEATMSGYEIRVDHSAGSDVVTIEAATIEEALQRASRIWSGTTQTLLLCTISRHPQTFLAW